MLNKRGGSEADLTVSRLEAGTANLPLAPEANGKEESGMGISFISIFIYYVFDRDIAHVSLIIICDLLTTCDLTSGNIYHLAECVCVCVLSQRKWNPRRWHCLCYSLTN
jgi:hypothetical protein